MSAQEYVLSFVDVQDPIKASKSYRGKRTKDEVIRHTTVLLDRGSTFLRPDFLYTDKKDSDLTFFTDVGATEFDSCLFTCTRSNGPIPTYTCTSHRSNVHLRPRVTRRDVAVEV